MTLTPGEKIVLEAIVRAKQNPVCISLIANLAAYNYFVARNHIVSLEKKNAIRRQRPKVGLPYYYDVL